MRTAPRIAVLAIAGTTIRKDLKIPGKGKAPRQQRGAFFLA
jgi:hypothetical protein